MKDNIDRIIFLDIDGVIIARYKKAEEAISNLNALSSAKVVISSSWFFEDACKFLKENGLVLEIIGSTKKRECEQRWLCRGNSIAEWLADHGYSIEYEVPNLKYVIFDDDEDFLLSQREHCIHVDERTGITDADIAAAKNILGL